MLVFAPVVEQYAPRSSCRRVTSRIEVMLKTNGGIEHAMEQYINVGQLRSFLHLVVSDVRLLE